MAYECITYEDVGDSVALVTLNRPNRLNALNRQLVSELEQVVDHVEESGEVRVLVFTGAPRADGRPCFSAGADLYEQADREESEEALLGTIRALVDRSFGPWLAGFCDRLETLGTPSIAAIDGICTAGGLELALSCDIRVASETAQISDLHIKNLGAIGGGGVTVRLARAVGPAWAKEIMFTGLPMGGQAAVDIGLANHVFAPDKLVEGAVALAKRFAAMRPQALAMAKAAMAASMDMDLGQALRFSYIGREVLSSKEGAKSFTQKQPPPHTRN
jgi:enoyl-CoA hydratase